MAYDIASSLGAIGSGLGGLFGNQENPYDAAKGYYERIPGETKPYFDPYINAGKDTLPGWQNAIQMLLNPIELMKMFMGSYEQSPEYKYNTEEATKAANQSAAAAGMGGTPAAQAELARTISGIGSQDRQNYINRLMQALTMGMGGASNISGLGQASASQMAQILAQSLAGQGNLAGQSAAWENQNSPWGNLSTIAGGVGGLIPGSSGGLPAPFK